MRNDVASAPQSLWANSAYDASARKTLISLSLSRKPNENCKEYEEDILFTDEFQEVLD